MKSRTASLRDLTPATFLKYERLNCLIENHANQHATVFLFELFEKAAIAQESRFLLVPRNANLYAQLMDGRKFAVKVSSQQVIYLLMTALSVNFNQETGSWNVPLNKIGKTLIKAAWQEFKGKHTQKRFHGSASAVIADPRMAELILSAADLAYAKYVDRGSDTLAA